jgi:hypothetical protein
MNLNNNYELASLSLNRVIVQTKYNMDEQCSICLSSMVNKTVLHIPCRHIFHNNCINTVFKSNCLAKYNCPLCRSDIYSSLKKLGFPPLLIEEEEEDIDDEHFDQSIDTVSVILEVIGNAFSPVCFRNIITNPESPLCVICKDAFINLTHTSDNLEIYIKTIIDEYNQLPNGIISLFDDIKNLLNFDDNLDEYMIHIFPNFENSRHH